MSLARAAPAPLMRECGSNNSGSSVLRKLTAATSLYDTQQPGPNAPDDGAAIGAAAWLQQQRLHLKVQDGDCPMGSVLSGQDREREGGAEGGKKLVPQHQQQPVDSEDVQLQQLLASEGLMRCETLNLFRAQLQQLSRRKDGLMPRADGSFPENWLLLAWEYQGLAEEVMSCQRWPGKYPEGLLRCVTHQVLYLKHRLEAFPTMSGAERDQFRRLYVLAALGIIAKLKLVTFCWTFVELKRGGEMAEQVTEVGRRQQSWQLQLAGNTPEMPVNIRTTPSTSSASAPCREPLAASALPSESVAVGEVPSVRIKKKAASQQLGHDIQSCGASDTSRSTRKKEERQRFHEEQLQQQEVRVQEHERSAVKLGGQHPQEAQPQQRRQRSEGEHRKKQEEMMLPEEMAENGRGSVSEGNACFPLSLTGTVAVEPDSAIHGKSGEKTEAASEDKSGAAQEVSSTCSFPSQRTEDLKEQQPAAGTNVDGTEGNKKAEGKQREHVEGTASDGQEEGKAEAPEKTKYTTRSGRRTHRVKPDIS